ncbi:MAG: DUF3253 domain-containing protein [Actinomycetota bacterium]|nr:DUF3253 domain-containing protein [Actinomycetota bacterium]
MSDDRLEQALRDLLAHRAGSACPSEVARAVGGERWRELMAPVRAAAGRLAARREVEVTQRGQVVDVASARGPVRVRRPQQTYGRGMLPERRTARLDVLVPGSVAPQPDGTLRVTGTVSLVRDADRVLVVDPGMVPRREDLLDALAALGVRPSDVTDVVLSHHHPDHTLNVALFPVVPVHDVQAVYEGDRWTRRPADGVLLAPAVRLLATPGHTGQDVTTLVGTPDGVAALTHLWWTGEGPADDPYAPDRALLSAQRARVLEVADLVVPGHGPAFRPGEATPR